ncbi:hypothetical protein EYC80_007790 [Monilinia laxa]|uniref:Protein kinase domain-containing protein n=1 Tax=Monilinia laxa TaxID=61186 RepID=A0A5N6JXE2_MONLA|nr:hypothetical protein EYC80_007790 [Monilinia laxa]
MVALIDPTSKQRYLDASKSWAPVAIGKDWVGTKYLGGGSYGMASLFEYQGDNPDVSPRKLVVKQEGGSGINLKQESRVLQRLMEYESNHIIKIYKAYHRTMGQGTAAHAYDPPIALYDEWVGPNEEEVQRQLKSPRHDVARIYLECASNGDLMDWMIKYCDELWPSEEHIWRLWECLLKGLMILKYGTEDWHDDLHGDDKKESHVPIAHFDLKGGNILISDNPKPGHDRIRIADFGLSIEVPDPKVLANDKRKARAWIAISEGRNTYHAPEQDFIDHPNRKIGHKTDLWNSALLIFMCMNKAKSFPRNEIFETGVDPEPSRIFKTMGARLLDPDREIYSRKLRGALLTALAYDPDDRWEVEEVLELVQEVLEHWSFGDEDDLFLGDPKADGRGWGGSYPDFSWFSDEDRGMTVLHPETKRADSVSGCCNPVNWNATEDEEDFADVGLLFPSHTDIRYGYREMPFEGGQAERPHPLFPSWRRVGKDGKPKRYSDSEDQEEEREEEEKTKSVTSNEDSSNDEDKHVASKSKSVKSQIKFEPRKIAGVKRMRSVSEQGEGKKAEDSDCFRFSGTPESHQAQRKRQSREYLKQTPIPVNLEYFVNDSGTVVQRAARPTPKEGEGEEILERSAPWIPVQPSTQSQDEWNIEETEGWDEG